tara:strand:+ start:604 stop:1740 length:1137 start_codon:yes stop_codon:yes gene_type:complete
MGYSELVKDQIYNDAETAKLNDICLKYKLHKSTLLVNVNPRTGKIEKFNLKTGVASQGRQFNKQDIKPFKLKPGTGSRGGKYRGAGGFNIESEVYNTLKRDISLDLYHLRSAGIVFGKLCPTKMTSSLFKKIKTNVTTNKQHLLEGISKNNIENTHRPISIKKQDIYFANNTNRNIADMTLHFNYLHSETAGTLSVSDEYISQKSTGLVTFINAGVRTKCFNPADLKNCLISKKLGVLLLKTLGLDMASFCNVFNNYANNNISDIKLIAKKHNRKFNFINAAADNKDFCNNLQKLIRKSMGNGNSIISHRINSKDIIYKTSDKNIKLLSYQSYYGGKKKTGKRVDIEVKTDNMIFTFNIRSKSGGIYPTHLCCDFKYY